jgi:hypothetical protein
MNGQGQSVLDWKTRIVEHPTRIGSKLYALKNPYGDYLMNQHGMVLAFPLPEAARLLGWEVCGICGEPMPRGYCYGCEVDLRNPLYGFGDDLYS